MTNEKKNRITRLIAASDALLAVQQTNGNTNVAKANLDDEIERFNQE